MDDRENRVKVATFEEIDEYAKRNKNSNETPPENHSSFSALFNDAVSFLSKSYRDNKIDLINKTVSELDSSISDISSVIYKGLVGATEGQKIQIADLFNNMTEKREDYFDKKSSIKKGGLNGFIAAFKI